MMLRLFTIALGTMGVGFSTIAPGTLGSLVGLLFAYGLTFLSKPLVLLTLVAFIFLSIWISSLAETYFHEKDSSRIVIDEVCGMMVSLLFVPWTFTNILIAFLLFRFFDIVKIPPINMLQKCPSGYGVVLDDIMAGVYVRLLFLIWQYS